ncbi:hypothetical protein ElyMa_004370900 [Elysia marginata]|uniref:Uncharacterized protein n=1 Tax=Elysia marginata TaxID=1093978 RepID=A0AAV4H935_9GAST|nr:hypothetical protein ElyMa_004370900 [Elysia marginata]
MVQSELDPLSPLTRNNPQPSINIPFRRSIRVGIKWASWFRGLRVGLLTWRLRVQFPTTTHIRVVFGKQLIHFLSPSTCNIGDSLQAVLEICGMLVFERQPAAVLSMSCSGTRVEFALVCKLKACLGKGVTS